MLLSVDLIKGTVSERTTRVLMKALKNISFKVDGTTRL